MQHFYVKFGDPSYIGLWDTVLCGETDRHTDKRRWKPDPPRLVTVVGKF